MNRKTALGVLAASGLAAVLYFYTFSVPNAQAPVSVAELPKESETLEAQAPAPTASSAAPDESASLLARKKFDRVLLRAHSSLPTKADIHKKSAEQVHEAPPEVLESGRRFGELAAFLGENPTFIPAALPAYVECALNEELVQAVQALCAYRIKLYEKHWDATTRAAYVKIPEATKKLATELEGTGE